MPVLSGPVPAVNREAAPARRRPLRAGAPYVYMLKARSPEEAATELTNVVWNHLLRVGLRPDPHRWSEVHGVLTAFLSPRTSFHKECGDAEPCRQGIRPAFFVYKHREPCERLQGRIGPYHLFELRQDPEELASSLEKLVERRFPGVLRASRTPAVANALLGEIRKALSHRLFFNHVCPACPVRSGPPDKVPHGSELKLWGGLPE